MDSYPLSKDDVIESFVRSSGPGGQHVNKVATCVVLLHKPSGIIVKCQEFRTQFLNRQRAWEMLGLQLQERQKREQMFRRALREKKRRQNRRPSVSARQKMLENKKKRAAKKQNRRKSGDWE